MSAGYPLLLLALGTLGAGAFLAIKARKDVADLKGHPGRSNIVKNSDEPPRQNMPGTEH